MGDTLELRENGEVVIGWDETVVTLRRPKVGEWLSFMEESEAADAWARGESAAEGETPTPRSIKDALADGPFLALYQRMILDLGGTQVETADMPTWLAVGDTMRRISAWWIASPLARSEVATLTRMQNP